MLQWQRENRFQIIQYGNNNSKEKMSSVLGSFRAQMSKSKKTIGIGQGMFLIEIFKMMYFF